jgi:hypothetical protein
MEIAVPRGELTLPSALVSCGNLAWLRLLASARRCSEAVRR